MVHQAIAEHPEILSYADELRDWIVERVGASE
jgi:hypothetical protein